MKNWIKISLFVLSLSAVALTAQHASAVELKGFPGTVTAQTDDWSCGPTVAAIMMEHYSSSLGSTFNHDFASFKNACPRAIDGKKFGTESVGPDPIALVAFMNAHSVAPVQYEIKKYETSDKAITGLVDQLKTQHVVMLLLKVGGFSLMDKIPQEFQLPAQFALMFMGVNANEIRIPLLHYILVTGYDSDSKTFTYVDSDLRTKPKTEAELGAEWNWTHGMSPEVFKGVQKILGLFAPKKLAEIGLDGVPRFINTTGNTSISVVGQ